MKRLAGLLFAISFAALLGCANPAGDSPEAVVNEPSAEKPAEAPGDAAAVEYTLTADSSIEFTGAKVVGSHDGGFKVFTGTISVPGGDIMQASVNVEIDMNSTWSDADKLTGHLLSADFFEVETYPTSSFVSTGVSKNEAGEMMLSGDFTLHGVTKNITFPFTAEVSDTLVTAQADFSIKRFDFGIEYPGMQDNMIKDEVAIRLNLIAAAGMDEGAAAEDASAEEGSAEEAPVEEASAEEAQTQPA